MGRDTESRLPRLLADEQARLLDGWLAELEQSALRRQGLLTVDQIRDQCTRFLELLRDGAQAAPLTDLEAPEWSPLREYLSRLVKARSGQGLSPREVALFIFALKKPVTELLRERLADDATALGDESWKANGLLDELGLYALDWALTEQQQIILRQQQDMLELSTPVIKLWEGVLALPLIGTLDSARTQVVTETLLQRIADTGSRLAILDITGVATVDTQVAQHLVRTVSAARLMGADCIISGIRPQIAQTMIHLGADLQGVTTKATLADALATALRRLGIEISEPGASRPEY